MAYFNCRVVGVLINDKMEILILKRNPNYLAQSKDDTEFIGWEFCGGGIEHDESPQDAIQREYSEETALEVEVSHIFSARSGERSGEPLINLCYVCKYISGSAELTDEHLDYQWVSLNELHSINMGPHGNIDKLCAIENLTLNFSR